MGEPKIRPASVADCERLTEIYNHYVKHTPLTFDIEEWTPERRRGWIEQHAETGRHQLLVAETDGVVAGYASTGPWRAKQAYEPSVEMSVYLAPESTGMGLGSALYRELFARLAREDVHRALAGITMPNTASIALHECFGFTKVAHFTENGRKHGRFWDVVWMEKCTFP